MNELDSLGGFVGCEQAPGYVTMWVIATAVERMDEKGSKWIGYDFPESPAGLHVPPEIVPKAGEKVACLVRFKPDRKVVWMKYAKLTKLGEAKTAAEMAWLTAKTQVDYLPSKGTANNMAWRKVSVAPMPEK